MAELGDRVEVLGLEFGQRAVSITYLDHRLDTPGVSKVQTMHIDPEREEFRALIVDLHDSALELVEAAEDVLRGTPLTRR